MSLRDSRIAGVSAVTAAAGAALLGLVLPLAAPAAAATPTIHFSEIYYNSPGTDRGGNTSLNGEWVQITNGGSRAASLTGWTVRDAANHVYTFGRYTLGAHASVRVHTGSGGNTAANRYWGLHWYVWNNDKDTARLRNSAGRAVDSCSYNNSHRAWTAC
ncbi:lamin tail domain-containing protein [Phaeacidiphilus oryzae]|uniref:lamin tail domain-containing protein n=1 Tax=Phaeacidiphilus oryzae TaxID=348818 RepID=UPI000568C3DF|nr:lamin tail domain-containing protein [Phaeacidiphilus oryzae]